MNSSHCTCQATLGTASGRAPRMLLWARTCREVLGRPASPPAPVCAAARSRQGQERDRESGSGGRCSSAQPSPRLLATPADRAMDGVLGTACPPTEGGSEASITECGQASSTTATSKLYLSSETPSSCPDSDAGPGCMMEEACQAQAWGAPHQPPRGHEAPLPILQITSKMSIYGALPPKPENQTTKNEHRIKAKPRKDSY